MEGGGGGGGGTLVNSSAAFLWLGGGTPYHQEYISDCTSHMCTPTHLSTTGKQYTVTLDVSVDDPMRVQMD